MTLLEALIDIRDNGPFDLSYDIPMLVVCYAEQDYTSTLITIWKRWPKYSEEPLFPVPHQTLPADAAYSSLNNLWDKATEYGQARWELLDFLIEEFSK